MYVDVSSTAAHRLPNATAGGYIDITFVNSSGAARGARAARRAMDARYRADSGRGRVTARPPRAPRRTPRILALEDYSGTTFRTLSTRQPSEPSEIASRCIAAMDGSAPGARDRVY
ncbi:hypothetical protein EVAR_44493_1 [Eumeta japonica]|uniref:Uncharacterized protein n=1 Tax=Eumeta variegata TaxID=151549 RepID=A0A4C1WN15_EUMVA|nr:hypothetical protein EVAR_44493_1 [Eumeta japonica]